MSVEYLIILESEDVIKKKEKERWEHATDQIWKI